MAFKNLFYIDGFLFGIEHREIDGVKIKAQHRRNGDVVLSLKDYKLAMAYYRLNAMEEIVENLKLRKHN